MILLRLWNSCRGNVAVPNGFYLEDRFGSRDLIEGVIYSFKQCKYLIWITDTLLTTTNTTIKQLLEQTPKYIRFIHEGTYLAHAVNPTISAKRIVVEGKYSAIAVDVLSR
jgi:hypothetical protein